MNNLNTTYISEQEHEENKRIVNIKLIWTAQIIKLNYKKLLEEKWINYYYELYKERFLKEWVLITILENYEKDLDDLIDKYCLICWDINIDIEKTKISSKIYLVYKELIEESRLMWNDKIVNKL